MTSPASEQAAEGNVRTLKQRHNVQYQCCLSWSGIIVEALILAQNLLFIVKRILPKARSVFSTATSKEKGQQ